MMDSCVRGVKNLERCSSYNLCAKLYSEISKLITSCISAITLPRSTLRTKSDVPFLSRLSTYITLKPLNYFLFWAFRISEQHLLILSTVANIHLPLSISLTLKTIGVFSYSKILLIFCSYAFFYFLTS